VANRYFHRFIFLVTCAMLVKMNLRKFPTLQ